MIALLLALLASPAAAQDGDPEVRARALFERAVVELEAGDRDRAIASFRASLDVHATPATAFNLAIALSDRGDAPEAVEILRGVIDGRFGPLPPDRIEAARATLAATRGELAVLEIRVEGADAARAVVGDRTIALARDPIAIAIPPGTISIRVEAGDRLPFVRTVELAPAADVAIVATLIAPAATAARPVETTSSRSILEEPAFWAVLGGGVALVAGAIVIGVVATQPQSPPLGTAETLTLSLP